MDRTIGVNVNGNYLTKDNSYAGVQHESNVTWLRIEFNDGWDGYAKTVTFWDAYGKNPVKRILTADLLEDIVKSERVYLCSIPGEAMTEAGNMKFVIDGYADGKRQRSVSAQLRVDPAPYAADASEPTDPTPTQAEQLQVQIDTVLDDMREQAQIATQQAGIATTAGTAAVASAEAAAVSESNAKASEDAAAVSESNAKASAGAAANSASTAATYATNASSAAKQAQSNAVTSYDHMLVAEEASAQAAESAASVADAVEAVEASATAAKAAESAATASVASASKSEGKAEEYMLQANASAVEAAEDRNVCQQAALTAAADRDRAEGAAASAEAAAEAASKYADKYPRIGDNGDWYVWSGTENNFIDSGVPASGSDGLSVYYSSVEYADWAVGERKAIPLDTISLAGRTPQVGELIITARGFLALIDRVLSSVVYAGLVATINVESGGDYADILQIANNAASLATSAQSKADSAAREASYAYDEAISKASIFYCYSDSTELWEIDEQLDNGNIVILNETDRYVPLVSADYGVAYIFRGAVDDTTVITGYIDIDGWTVTESAIGGDGNWAEEDHRHSASDIGSGVFSTALLPTVPVSKGGTGLTTLSSGSYLVGNGTGSVTLKTPAQVLSHIGAASTAYVDNAIANISTGGSGGAAIIDVLELPTENIDESVFYRVNKVPMMFGTAVLSVSACYCVDSLPTVGEPVTVDMQSLLGYYNKQDGNVYGYVPAALGAGVGVPAGWYPFGALAGAFGVGWSGVITSEKEAADDESYRVLLRSFKMYRYSNGWHLIVDDTEFNDLFSEKEPAIRQIVGEEINIPLIDLRDYFSSTLNANFAEVSGDFSELNFTLQNLYIRSKEVRVLFSSFGMLTVIVATVGQDMYGNYTITGEFFEKANDVTTIYQLQAIVSSDKLSARCFPLRTDTDIYIRDSKTGSIHRIALENAQLKVYSTLY